MQKQEFKFVFYGVRGSYPVPHPGIAKYGGNTSCILIEKSDKLIILDAGTGIINIGNYLKEKKPQIKEVDIFLTHFHIDHIQGLPFFEPVFSNEYTINIYSFPYDNMPFKDIILSLFNQPYSPISNKGIKADLNFFQLNMEKPKAIEFRNGLSVEYIKEKSHPLSGVLIYKITSGEKSLVYATDVESPQGFESHIIEFIGNPDVLIHDSQYFDEDYNAKAFPKKGFGHSTVSMATGNAIKTGAKNLFLFHYDPGYDDERVERLLDEARKIFKNSHLSQELKEFNL